MADQSPQGLIASVEKTTSIPVESTGAIIYRDWLLYADVRQPSSSRNPVSVDDGERAAKRNVGETGTVTELHNKTQN